MLLGRTVCLQRHSTSPLKLVLQMDRFIGSSILLTNRYGHSEYYILFYKQALSETNCSLILF